MSSRFTRDGSRLSTGISDGEKGLPNHPALSNLNPDSRMDLPDSHNPLESLGISGRTGGRRTGDDSPSTLSPSSIYRQSPPPAKLSPPDPLQIDPVHPVQYDPVPPESSDQPPTLNIKLTEMQRDFAFSSAFESLIVSSRGEGKTDACIFKMCAKSVEQAPEYRPMIWAGVRDTWTNLERTLVRSILFPQPGSVGEQINKGDFNILSEDGGRVIHWLYKDSPLWTCFMFGCDSAADISKFQSLQLGGFIMEEAAPAAIVDIGGGIGENVYLIGITSLRQPLSTKPCAIISENFPDKDHWSWRRFHNPEVVEHYKALGETIEIFQLPTWSNPFLPEGYRERNEAALRGNPSLLARLVRGEADDIQIGEVVMPEYNPAIHFSPIMINPVPGVETFRFWDGWHHPSCVFGQIINGKLLLTDAIFGENEAVTQLIPSRVIPMMNTRYRGVTRWRDIGDPSMEDGDQSDKTKSAALTINAMLHANFESGTSTWGPRREAFKDALTRQLILVSNHLTFIDKGLKAGWHYRRLSTGQVQRDIPVKNEYSHPLDAVSYGIPKIFSLSDRQEPDFKIDMAKIRKRAMSYGGRSAMDMSKFPKEGLRNTSW